MRARYAHTNLVARDWRALATFYQEVFGCRPVPPERAQSGDWLERGTGVPGAALEGMHLRLPGQGEDGATLEIYTYATLAERLPPAANRPGFGHLAFEVDDVEAALAEVVRRGGRARGSTASAEIAGKGRITFVYAEDPEGNLLELQRWE